MHTAARSLRLLIHICGSGALILGLAFWSGYARSFTHLHMILGIAVVVSLWALAALALRSKARTGLVAFAAGWGALTWVFGVTQEQVLPGSLHWVVAVVHLVLGVIAIGIGSGLAGAIESCATQSRTPGEATLAVSGHR